jgi:ribosomal protein S18 acetylase RimI-like enzyme
MRLALANHMFEVGELGGMAEMLHGYLDGSLEDHNWVVATRADDVVGAAYYAPEPFSDRLWNLYFIAVDPGCHGMGTGTLLLAHVEKALQDQGEDVARILIVETSSTDLYANARGFYRARGYDEEARIRDFYGPGDDKVVYWKALTNRAP